MRGDQPFLVGGAALLLEPAEASVVCLLILHQGAREWLVIVLILSASQKANLLIYHLDFVLVNQEDLLGRQEADGQDEPVLPSINNCRLMRSLSGHLHLKLKVLRYLLGD